MYSTRANVIRSLRFRLTAWNTALVCLVILLALAGVREGLRVALTNESVSVLREYAAELTFMVQQTYPDMPRLYDQMEGMDLSHEPHGLFLQLFDSRGNLLWSSSHTPKDLQLPPPRRQTELLSTAPQLRVLQQSVVMPDGDLLGTRVGMSLLTVNRDVARITQLSLIVAVVLLIAAPLGGYWLAGRATRPLSDIIVTARDLRPHDLTQRLPLRNTGDELDLLSQTINELLDRIGGYLSRHEDFVANAAHELRSPVTALQTSIEVALSTERSAEEYRELLYSVLADCQDLASLINQLLLLSEASRISAHGEISDLADAAHRSVDMFHGVAEEREVKIITHLEEACLVEARASHLRQLATNLIDNALKFTPAGGTVWVEVTADTQQRLTTLRVTDTGCGIPQQALARIFERFYQVDVSHDRSGQRRGTGLGLSICESIVQAYGGKIEILTPETGGTCVQIQLPLHIPTAAPPLSTA